jgi:hypothetical protein
MIQIRSRAYPGIAALAAIAMFFVLGGSAQAEPDEDGPSPSAEATASSPPKPELAPTLAVPGGEAPAPATQTPASFFEQMGPDTFPGRLRGLSGGSLWLEPSFHGLQWPRNTRTGIGVSGMFWVDGGYETIVRGDVNNSPTPNSTYYFQQGRALLRVTPAYVSGRLFVQGQVELVGNLCQAEANAAQTCNYAGTFTTDDLWIRVGQFNLWDLKVGRFEGWEVYHLGMGMDPNTYERVGATMSGLQSEKTVLEAPSAYALNSLHDRPTDGQAVAYSALHFYPLEFLRAELLFKLGNNKFRLDNLDSAGTSYNYYGLRPSAIFDAGWIKFKVGAEYQKRTATTQTLPAGVPVVKKDPVEDRVDKGIGASLQFVVDPLVEFGLNAAIGTRHETNVMAIEIPEGSFTRISAGGFANLRFADGWLAGVGGNWTLMTNSVKATPDSANDAVSHLQGFVALQYLLVRQLYIKAVLGYAKARFQPSDATVATWNNSMYSGRIRLMYLY